MDVAIAYSTLAVTVSLAVFRPRLRRPAVRITPGSAALLGVIILAATGLLDRQQMIDAARLQWRPLLALTSIMVMTGVVHDVGAFERMAAWIETRSQGRSAHHAFAMIFGLSVITPTLLNNDAAILILTPLVVALSRRLYPGRPDLTLAFAFAVFLAPGVAPLVVSNPMNMIVADYAGIGFNEYAAIMAPISLVGAIVTYAVLRWIYRDVLGAHAAVKPTKIPPRHRAERPLLILLFAVFAAYPVAASFDFPIWTVAGIGALLSLGLATRHRVTTPRRAVRHVSVDILVFLWGIFLVVQGLESVGVTELLRDVYTASPAGSGAKLAVVGVFSAVGSATIDNHPMSILNMVALQADGDSKLLLAALVGGDIGPRLLPIGSLAGLLWIELLRRAGVQVGVKRFVRTGTLVLIPTLALSLLLLWLA